MLDQSFSAENFRKILDYENRKGIYLEGKFFPDIVKITDEIRKLTANIKTRPIVVDDATYQGWLDKREKLKEKKESKLSKELQEISEKIISGTFDCTLKAIVIPGWKPMYKIDSTPETYFTIKQVQKNIFDLYKVKQSNRIEIVSQIKNLLDDSFPKIIVRTDIKDFYESIPHDKILKRVNEENLLDFLSKRVIRNLLRAYSKITGRSIGIPRGVGVSAYLAELYMKDIDKEIQALPHLVYYARYVDDIIVVFVPENVRHNPDYVTLIRQLIGSPKNQLMLNPRKTSLYSTISPLQDFGFTFLGYKIDLKRETGNKEVYEPIKISLSEHKIDKYKSRIVASLNAYISDSVHNQRSARKMLLKRINFLTTNTKLINSKSNIIVGVHYSNILINHLDDFQHLDRCLRCIFRRN
jgi:hypothetical protein